MSIHYKFKSAIDYDTITFDGLHISVLDLKKAIVQQKKLGKATDFDLLITNAQTDEGISFNLSVYSKVNLKLTILPHSLHRRDCLDRQEHIPHCC